MSNLNNIIEFEVVTATGIKEHSLRTDVNYPPELNDKLVSALKCVLRGFDGETSDIKNLRFLERFIVSNYLMPKYQVGDYVDIKSFGLERIPNPTLHVEISNYELDYSNMQILYLCHYELDGEFGLVAVKEKDILGLQDISNLTFLNYHGRNDLERYQHLKMLHRSIDS